MAPSSRKDSEINFPAFMIKGSDTRSERFVHSGTDRASFGGSTSESTRRSSIGSCAIFWAGKHPTNAVQARAGSPFCGLLGALAPPCLTADVWCLRHEASIVQSPECRRSRRLGRCCSGGAGLLGGGVRRGHLLPGNLLSQFSVSTTALHAHRAQLARRCPRFQHHGYWT